MGQAPSGDAYNDEGDGWPLIAGAGDFGDLYPSPKKYTREASRVSKAGDIVLGIRASIGEKVLADGEYCLGRGVAGFRAGKDLDSRYLWHWLTQIQPELAGKARGATFLQVNKNDIAELEIALLPLPEQRRIAAILDQAEALRAKRREALAQLDSLTQSIFIEMFGSNDQSPVTVGDRLTTHPQGWKWDLLTDVGRLATGHTPDRKREDYWGGEIPWITLTEIRQFDGKTASTTKERITEAGLQNSSAVLLPTGTVCFSRTASIGFVTVMGRPMATSQDFVNWVCGERLHPTYLMHAFLQSRSRLRSLSTGSTHKTIYFPTVERFRVLVPPLDMQECFATRIQAVEALKATHHAALAETDALFASLQHRAFTGQLS
jgi:type I restriction enzyme S subunit